MCPRSLPDRRDFTGEEEGADGAAEMLPHPAGKAALRAAAGR